MLNYAFIAEFYKYSFVGILLDWIRQGMTADYRIIAGKICTLMQGSVSHAIQNFEAERQRKT